MANEISVGGSLTYSKNKAKATLSGTFLASQTGDKYISAIVSVATTETTVDKGGIGSIGYLAVRNNDATNFVQFGHTTGVYGVKLLPGEFMVVPWKYSAILALADTAAVEIEYLAIEL